jgi:hypothetical protein
MKFELSQPEVIRHLILLVIGWLVLSLMVGLFETFDQLEASTKENQTAAIFQGLKISSITFFVGAIVISSSLAFFLLNKKRER